MYLRHMPNDLWEEPEVFYLRPLLGDLGMVPEVFYLRSLPSDLGKHRGLARHERRHRQA